MKDTFFYIIQVAPELCANRIKFGISHSPEARLGLFKTVAPSAVLVRKWPCLRQHEKQTINAVTASGCVQIGAEVFDVDSLEQVIERVDRALCHDNGQSRMDGGPPDLVFWHRAVVAEMVDDQRRDGMLPSESAKLLSYSILTLADEVAKSRQDIVQALNRIADRIR